MAASNKSFLECKACEMLTLESLLCHTTHMCTTASFTSAHYSSEVTKPYSSLWMECAVMPSQLNIIYNDFLADVPGVRLFLDLISLAYYTEVPGSIPASTYPTSTKLLR